MFVSLKVCQNPLVSAMGLILVCFSVFFTSCTGSTSGLEEPLWEDVKNSKSLKCQSIPLKDGDMLTDEVIPSLDPKTNAPVLIVHNITRVKKSRFYQINFSDLDSIDQDKMRSVNRMSEVEDIARHSHAKRLEPISDEVISRLKKTTGGLFDLEASSIQMYSNPKITALSYVVGSALMGEDSTLNLNVKVDKEWKKSSAQLEDRDIIQYWWVHINSQPSILALENIDDIAVTAIYGIEGDKIRRQLYKGRFDQSTQLADVLEYQGKIYLIVRGKGKAMEAERWSVCT